MGSNETNTGNEAMFNAIAFQDSLIERVLYIAANGIGLHQKRSRGRLWNKAQRELEAKGYPENQAEAVVRDAFQMADLQLLADECE